MILYAQEFAVYNVHGRLHTNEDALNFGSLDNISTFSFESFMQKIKGFIHSHNYHLEQTAKRNLEIESFYCDRNASFYKRATNFSLSPVKACKNGDYCFMLKSGQIVVLSNWVNRVDDKFTFSGQQFQK